MYFLKHHKIIQYIMLALTGFFFIFLTSCEGKEEIPEKIYHTVTYNLDGIESTMTVEDGSLLEQPKAPSKEGYEFKGWFNGNIYHDFENNKVNSDITLSAKWEVNKYKLTIQYNNGSQEQEEVYNYGDKIKLDLDNIKRTGYSFAGWSEEVPETMPAHNVSLYAKWKINTYNLVIKYDNGQEDLVMTYQYNQEISIANDLLVCSKEGYRFDGWSEDVPETMPATNVTIKAIWIAIPPAEVTIVYNDGVTNNRIINQIPGSTFPTISDPTRQGYTFIGWSREIPELMPNESMLIEANWTISTYSLTIHDYYGEGVELVQRFNYGEKINIIDPIYNGYTFKGYYITVNETSYQRDLTVMGEGDIEVTALWELNTYTITYHYDNDAVVTGLVESYTVLEDDFNLINPVKDGSIFRGWYKEAYYENQVTTIFTENVMNYYLYAKFDLCLDMPYTKSTFIYNGEKQSPVWINLSEGINCTGNYQNMLKAGDYTATFKLLDGYCWLDGSREDYSVDWTIQKREITLEWSNTSTVYNGYNQYPNVKVIKDSGKTLSTIYVKKSYKDVGSYEMTIDQINKDYSNDIFDNYIIQNATTTFTITPATIDNAVLKQSTFIYTGVAPEVKVNYVYSNNRIVSSYDISGDLTGKNVGKYSFTITGKLNWQGSITVEYEIIKADSAINPIQETIDVYVGDTIKINNLVQNYNGNLSATIDNEQFLTPSTITNGVIQVGTLYASRDNAVEQWVEITDSGDSNHNANKTKVALKVHKKQTSLTFADEYYALDVFQLVSLNDIDFVVSPSISDGVYKIKLLNECDNLIIDYNALTIKGQFATETEYAVLRVTRESSSTTLEASVDIPIKVNKIQGLQGTYTTDGIFAFGRPITIVASNPTTDFALRYDWYYYADTDEKVFYGNNNPVLRITDLIYVDTKFGCYISIDDVNKDRYYENTDCFITEGTIAGPTLLTKTDGSDAIYTVTISQNTAVNITIDVSEETGHPLQCIDDECSLNNAVNKDLIRDSSNNICRFCMVCYIDSNISNTKYLMSSFQFSQTASDNVTISTYAIDGYLLRKEYSGGYTYGTNGFASLQKVYFLGIDGYIYYIEVTINNAKQK